MSCNTPFKNRPAESLAHTGQARRAAARMAAGGLLLLAGASLRQATAQTSTKLPAEVATELPAALWSGSSRMRFFGFDIYDASLWVAPGFRATVFSQHPLALTLTYLRAFKGREIAQRSLQEMKRQGDLTAAREEKWLAAMAEAFPDIQAGERLTGVHLPGQGARFWHQGQARASVPDPEFSRRFFGIWLADTSSEPQLRTALLQRAPA